MISCLSAPLSAARVAVIAVVAVLAALTAPASAEPVLCDFLAPTADHPFIPNDAQCVERERMVVDGRQYLFAEFVGFRAAAGLDHIALARDAVARSVATFSRWYAMPEAIVYFGNASSDPRRLLGVALGVYYGCVIYIDDSALRAATADDSAQNQLKRTVAHELFHCAQYTDRSAMGPRMAAYPEGDWWIEGSAELFAGLAIPESRPGPSYYRDFPQRIIEAALYRIHATAYPFFAFLNNERGTDAVVALLRNVGGGEPGARDMLRSIPDADGLFLALARATFDGRLADEQGRSLGLSAPETISTVISGPMTLDIGVEPFRLSALRLRIESGLAFKVDAPTGPNEPRAQLSEDPGEWRDPPTRIGKCLGTEALLIAISTGLPLGELPAQVRITDMADRLALVECPCPLGVWRQDLDELRASGWGAEGRYERGAVMLEFRPDGTSVGYFDDFTILSSIGANAGAIRRIDRSVAEWRWVRRGWSAARIAGPAPSSRGIEAFAIERTLTANRPSFTLQFLDQRGNVISEQTTARPGPVAPSVSIHGAVCEGDTLRLIGGASSPGARALPFYQGTFRR